MPIEVTSFAAGTAFVVSIVLGWILPLHAHRLGLVVVPGEHRQHSKPTPVVGGIAIITAVTFATLIWHPASLSPFSAIFILLLIGIVDDVLHLPSWLRLAVQCLAVSVLMLTSNMMLTDLGDIFGTGNVTLGNASIVMTLFACIGVINAVNMSDGMDGLAGCLVVVVCAALILSGGPSLGLSVILVGAVLGFLYWNMRLFRRSASIFMGDAGSTTLGLLLAYLLIQASQGENAVIAPVTALWFLALPLIDAVGVLIVRPLRGRSPFSADHLHYHHALRELGFSVNHTLWLAVSLQVVLAGLGLFMLQQGVTENVQLNLFLGLFFAYLAFLYHRSKTHDF